jgi:hypothetical protein
MAKPGHDEPKYLSTYLTPAAMVRRKKTPQWPRLAAEYGGLVH